MVPGMDADKYERGTVYWDDAPYGADRNMVSILLQARAFDALIIRCACLRFNCEQKMPFRWSDENTNHLHLHRGNLVPFAPPPTHPHRARCTCYCYCGLRGDKPCQERCWNTSRSACGAQILLYVDGCVTDTGTANSQSHKTLVRCAALRDNRGVVFPSVNTHTEGPEMR